MSSDLCLADKPLWRHQEQELPYLLPIGAKRLLAWEPGTGKTRAVLEAARRLGDCRVLVVVPANTRSQWASVAEEYGFRVQEVSKATEPIDPRADIAVVSYEMVHREVIWKSAMTQHWDALALDEVHYVKTPSAKRTRAIFGARADSKAALYRAADRVWCLSGTPMTKDPSDLWVLASRLFPEVLAAERIRTKDEWVQRWCTGRLTPYGFQVTGARDPDRLHALLAPHMSRVRKRDVLPELQEPIFDKFLLPPRKIAVEDAAHPEIQAFLEALKAANEGNARALEVVASDPVVSSLRREIGKSKAEEVAEQIVSELSVTGEKALVFFQHTEVGHTIFEHLERARLNPVLFDGTLSPAVKEANRKRFATDPGCLAFVGQIQAAGTGVDGLQVASRVFIAEEPWTPGLLDQIVSRADRAGQQAQVYVTSFLIKGSYDEEVSRVLKRRVKIVSRIIDGVV